MLQEIKQLGRERLIQLCHLVVRSAKDKIRASYFLCTIYEMRTVIDRVKGGEKSNCKSIHSEFLLLWPCLICLDHYLMMDDVSNFNYCSVIYITESIHWVSNVIANYAI